MWMFFESVDGLCPPKVSCSRVVTFSCRPPFNEKPKGGVFNDAKRGSSS